MAIESCLNCLNFILCLPIRLWVEGFWELEIGPQHLEEFRLKTPSEPRVSVCHNVLRNSPKLHDVLDEETDYLVNFAIGWYGNKSGVLAVTVDNDHNAAVPFGF